METGAATVVLTPEMAEDLRNHIDIWLKKRRPIIDLISCTVCLVSMVEAELGNHGCKGRSNG